MGNITCKCKCLKNETENEMNIPDDNLDENNKDFEFKTRATNSNIDYSTEPTNGVDGDYNLFPVKNNSQNIYIENNEK